MTTKNEDIIIEEVLFKKVTSFSHSSHIILPKRYEDREVFVVLINRYNAKPRIHKDRTKEIDGKTYYQGEISDSAGTHSFWIEKSKVKKIFTRDNI